MPRESRKTSLLGDAGRALLPALAPFGGAAVGVLCLGLFAFGCAVTGEEWDGTFGSRDALLWAAMLLLCVLFTWLLSFVAVRRSRGDALQNRAYSVAAWSVGAPILWCLTLAGVAMVRRGDVVDIGGVGLTAALAAPLSWFATLTPVFSYRLARRALEDAPGTGVAVRRGRDELDEDAEVEEGFTLGEPGELAGGGPL